jgi:hypothetical protein
MASYKTVFGSFLKQEDLAGKAAKVVIEEVGMEEIQGDDGKESKLVARFVGKTKALVLNRTNCESIEAIAGTDDYGRWAGHAVVLYVDPSVKFGGKTVGGIRIRATLAAAPPPPPPPAADDELDEAIPF